jgi:hypothetical protein
VASLLSGIAIKTSNLRAQTAPLATISRLKATKEEAQRALPGYESMHVNRLEINSLRVWKSSVSEVRGGCFSESSVLVAHRRSLRSFAPPCAKWTRLSSTTPSTARRR